MDEHLERMCEEIDAAFFSGDGFHSRKALEEIRAYLGRWERESNQIEKMLDEEDKENEDAEV